METDCGSMRPRMRSVNRIMRYVAANVWILDSSYGVPEPSIGGGGNEGYLLRPTPSADFAFLRPVNFCFPIDTGLGPLRSSPLNSGHRELSFGSLFAGEPRVID
jgi:hypothetical protein